MQFLVLPERSTAFHIIQVWTSSYLEWRKSDCPSLRVVVFQLQTNTDINFDPSEINLTHNLIIWT